MKQYKILIVGGGIAGLSAMRALQMRGFSPELVEQSDTIRSDGTGILLGFNAVSVLDNLGLKNEIEEAGVRLATMSAFDEKGKSVVACNLEYVQEKSSYATYGIDRESLVRIVSQSIHQADIKTGSKVQHIINTPHGVEAVFDDGYAKHYDLIIGADGIHSTVKKAVFGEVPLRDAKQGCWRFIAKIPEDFTQKGIFEYFGVGKRAGYMPMQNGELYAYILLNASEYDPNNMPSTEELLERCQEFEGDWHSISLALKHPLKTRFDAIKDLSQICIAKDRVVLIGDAAHAITPNLGQGAAMGLEDAELLAYYLEAEDSVQSALKAFEKRRYKRVEAIKAKSYIIGKIAQSSSPIFCRLRNAFYRLLPSRLIAEDTLKILEQH
ncbi:MAG: FAD-dependent monooxygenase [Sulfurimonadaceae bacterium]